MAVGMFFTLAFLPVGLIVAIVVCGERAIAWRRRALLIAAIGSGFLLLIFCGWAITQADPFVIGWWNLHHHARFYDEYPRTYRLWLAINPLELAIALGIPSVVWCITALREPRGIPISAWSTLVVLTLANLIGRNMGEVARLWLLYMPPLLVGAGFGCARWSHRPVAVAGSIALLGADSGAAIDDPGGLSRVNARSNPRPRRAFSQENAGHAHPEVGIDQDQLAAGDEPAV